MVEVSYTSCYGFYWHIKPHPLVFGAINSVETFTSTYKLYYIRTYIYNRNAVSQLIKPFSFIEGYQAVGISSASSTYCQQILWVYSNKTDMWPQIQNGT